MTTSMALKQSLMNLTVDTVQYLSVVLISLCLRRSRKVLTSVSTYKAGFPYTANHPKRVLITYVKRIKEMDAFMVSGVLKVRKRDRSTLRSIE